jgi:hypothetical protein
MAGIDAVTLETLARGAALERFDIELARVMENINDPNTGDGKREITVKVSIKPSQTKDTAQVMVNVTSKLASMAPYPTLLFLSKGRDGRLGAYENDPRQVDMFEGNEKVTKFEERKAAGEQ